jgi:hypothetical protein
MQRLGNPRDHQSASVENIVVGVFSDAEMIFTRGKPDQTDASCYERFNLKFRMKAGIEASKKGPLQNVDD